MLIFLAGILTYYTSSQYSPCQMCVWQLSNLMWWKKTWASDPHVCFLSFKACVSWASVPKCEAVFSMKPQSPLTTNAQLSI